MTMGIAASAALAQDSAAPPKYRAELVGTVTGLKAPECAVADSKNGLVYISNVDTDNEEYWLDDAKSHVTLMTSDGKVLKKRWVNSTAHMPLHAIKGMCLLNDTIYAADNTRIIKRSVKPGGHVEIIPVPNAAKVNDVATDGKFVYATDTQRGVLYKINPANNEITEMKAPPSINGITIRDGVFYAVSWGRHEIYTLDPEGNSDPEPFGLAEYFINLDGIEALDDGTLLVSDFSGNRVVTVSPDRKTVTTIAEVESAADIGFDPARKLLYVPSLLTGKLAIFRLIKE